MQETDVVIQSGATRLAGTFCVPARNGFFPAVLMTHGSGPLDRDENMKGQSLDIFNTIARGLYHSLCKSVMEVVSSGYWSSTTNAFYTDYALVFDFHSAFVDSRSKSLSYYVRAVRSAK